MKQMIKRFFAFAALAMATGSYAAVAQSQNTALWQAQYTNASVELAQQNAAHYNMEADGGWFGTANVNVRYERNWAQEDGVGVGAMPFWSGKNSMKVAAVGAASGVDLSAYQMGLGTAATGTKLSLDPKVYQARADFFLYAGAEQHEAGFWGKVQVPVGVQYVDPQLVSDVKAAGDYAAKDVTLAILTPVLTSLEEAFAGGKDAGATDKLLGLTKGKIDGKRNSGGKVGDVMFALGYNFLADEDKTVGLAVRAGAPAGNKPTAEYVLEPVFGRGGHWTLGGELNGNFKLWEGSNDNALRLSMLVHAEHAFKKVLPRSFDLKANGAGSKYLLVGKFATTTTEMAAGSNVSQNLVNLSTLDAESSFSVEGAAALQLDYMTGAWCLGLGYEFQGRAEETLTLTGSLPTDAAYGVLGENGTYAIGTGIANVRITPNAVMGAATAAAAAGPAAADMLVNADLDVDAAKMASSAASRLYGHVQYVFQDSEYCPHLGVNGSVSFSHSDNNALPQWGVGVQGGISF